MLLPQSRGLCFLHVALFAATTMLAQVSHGQEEWTPELSFSVNPLSDLYFSPDNQKLLYGIASVDLENDAYLNRN